MMNETKTGLFTLATGSTNPFKTAIGGRFYFEEAPEYATFPYAVVHDIAPGTERDSATKIETERIQITIYDNSGSSLLIGQIQRKLWDLFDDKEATLSVSGYHVAEFSRDSPSGFQFKAETIWQSVTGYKILLSK